MFVGPGEPSPHYLEWRIRIFGAGAIIGLGGIWADQRWLVNVAIGVLAVGMLLRALRQRGTSAEGEDETG